MAARLYTELQQLRESPLEGVQVYPVNEENLYEWETIITGLPGTLFAGGQFVARLDFPKNYPHSPPKMKFLSEIFHPNIYESGEVCISILHPPGADPFGYESAAERWRSVQTINSILLSVVVMLNDPNPYSPANPTAAKLFRDNKEEFKEKANHCIKKSLEQAKWKRFREEKKKQDEDYASALMVDISKEEEEKEKSLMKEKKDEASGSCTMKKNDSEGREKDPTTKRKCDGQLSGPAEIKQIKFNVSPEPATDCDKPTVSLQFQVGLDGSIIAPRRFLTTDNVKNIYDYIRSKGYEPQNFKVSVTTSFPAKDLSEVDQQTTIEALKLGKRDKIRLSEKV